MPPPPLSLSLSVLLYALNPNAHPAFLLLLGMHVPLPLDAIPPLGNSFPDLHRLLASPQAPFPHPSFSLLYHLRIVPALQVRPLALLGNQQPGRLIADLTVVQS
jgi:hypothetical protein